MREVHELHAHEKASARQETGGVADAVVALLYQFRKNVHTITTDNGVEFRNHAKIAKELNTTVSFADSYASWQKGAIENTNKLIRQYIPKGTNFNDITDDYIHSVQLRLNRRPRQKLNFSTPKDVFLKSFVVTLHLLVDSALYIYMWK